MSIHITLNEKWEFNDPYKGLSIGTIDLSHVKDGKNVKYFKYGIFNTVGDLIVQDHMSHGWINSLNSLSHAYNEAKKEIDCWEKLGYLNK